MTTICKPITAWILAFIGSLLLPLVSVAAVSGTTCDAPSTTTTAPANTVEHTASVEMVGRGGASLLGTASSQARSLLALSHFLNAAESPSFNSIMRQVETVDVSTPRNGAVFWTGYERGNQAAAMKWAAANGKSTIEMTPGGQWLNSLDLYGVNSPLTRAEADAAWLRMSERFTEGASGHINAFTRGTSFNPASNFYNTELPGLRLNPNVSPTITYRGY